MGRGREGRGGSEGVGEGGETRGEAASGAPAGVAGADAVALPLPLPLPFQGWCCCCRLASGLTRGMGLAIGLSLGVLADSSVGQSGVLAFGMSHCQASLGSAAHWLELVTLASRLARAGAG